MLGKEDNNNNNDEDDDKDKPSVPLSVTAPADPVKDQQPRRKLFSRPTPAEEVDICIIGGGVSGLTAAITAAEALANATATTATTTTTKKIVVLEASSGWGGRVASDVTDDGYVLDRGFAVFIEEYPLAKQLLDYNALQLKPFLPGALVKVPDNNDDATTTTTTTLARVADPLRNPGDLIPALLAPIGTLWDKIEILPMVLHFRSTSIDDLFAEEETDTLTALQQRWGFSQQIIDSFFRPFLEGIYLAPLEEQSSRMFSFVFKMFSEGCATLPRGGMGQVSEQLRQRATDLGVTLRANHPVAFVHCSNDDNDNVDNDNNNNNNQRTTSTFVIETADHKTRLQAKSVIVATDGHVAQKLLAKVDATFHSLETLEEQPQRAVGCLYYGFDCSGNVSSLSSSLSSPPIQDAILILNGVAHDRGTRANPINNVCFPSVVNEGYAPPGCHLCSVTVLKSVMDAFQGREDELDAAVRRQLGTWFPEYKSSIQNDWKLLQIYSISNAQPGQLRGPAPANVNGGRDCRLFRGLVLPPGLVVCGDHMATATLNGALESGINAGKAAAQVLTLVP